MTRLFVAAWPPRSLAVELARIADLAEDGVRPVPPDHLHVTLRFVGDADADEVAARLDGIELTAGTARLGPTIVRLGGRQMVAPVTGADRLAAAVRAATHQLGDPDRRAFFGHLTLARLGRGVTSELEGTSIDGEFPLDDVRLVESRLAPTGSVYTTLRTFPVG